MSKIQEAINTLRQRIGIAKCSADNANYDCGITIEEAEELLSALLEQVERIENLEDALRRIQTWANAYPPDEIRNRILHHFGRLSTENERMKKLIESYGNNPAGFDWEVLGQIDDLERENQTLVRNLKEIGAVADKAYREATNEHGNLHLISVMAREAVKDPNPPGQENKNGKEKRRSAASYDRR